MYHRLLILLLLFLSTGAVSAQEVVFHTEVSADKIGRQDHLRVDYVLKNARQIQSIIPQGIQEDFEILSGPMRNSSTSLRIVNGRSEQQSTMTLSFYLQPKRLGKLVVPEAVAQDAEGNTYRSNPVTITVIPGRYQQPPSRQDMARDQNRRRQQRREAYEEARKQQREEIVREVDQQIDIDRDLFIRVEVDKQQAYLGEQITASYKLYSRVPMKVNISKLPSLHGFWTQDFEIPQGNARPTEEVVDGRRYQVFLLKKSALFPQQDGRLELDAAEAEGVARVVREVKHRHPLADWMDQNSLFGSLMIDDPFFRSDLFTTQVFKDIPVKLRSRPIKIEVLPLPDSGRSDDFSGAVGQFTMKMELDRNQMTTDDQISLHLRIIGSGNIKLFEAPELDLPAGLVAYDPLVLDSITGRSTTIRGEKNIRYSIGALRPGKYEIPAMRFVYFDPQKEQYVTLNTEPVSIEVSPGEGFDAMVAGKGLITDLHPLRDLSARGEAYAVKPWFFRPGYWSFYLVPLMGFVGFVFWRRREEQLSRDPEALKRRRANRIAGRRLRLARQKKEAQDHQGFYEELSKAIWLYLSDKLGIALSDLSRETAESALSQRSIPESLMQRLESLLDDCQAALYAPNRGGASRSNAYDEAVQIISELEEKMKT